jgi:hypothetical protein
MVSYVQMMRLRTLLLLTGCVALPLFATSSCGEYAAIDITLNPDSNRNTAGDVVAAVSVIQLVADGENLYPAQTEHRGQTVEVFDIDDDGAPELVATIDMSEMTNLPLVRLERGGIDSVEPFDLTVDGFRSGENRAPVAQGSELGVAFPRDSIDSLTVSFNILDRYLPPRVNRNQSGPYREDQTQPIKTILIVFTKKMQLSSLNQSTIGLFTGDDSNRQLVEAEEIRFQVFPLEDMPTFAWYRLAAPLEPGRYWVVVETDARDDTPEQRQLDQEPKTPGNQPYILEFRVAEDDRAESVANQPAANRPMTQDEWSPMAGGGTTGADAKEPETSCQRDGQTPCPDGTRCDDDIALCLPLACPDDCGAGFVCHPTWNLCVLD